MRQTWRMDRPQAYAFMSIKADDGKTLFPDHDILYLYHNRIDTIGDKLASGDRVTEATEDAVEGLTKLVRKPTTANFSTILITADRGFLYQHRPLDDTEFSVADPTGVEILFKNRRFVIERGLIQTAGMKKFSSKELGTSGDLDVLIPNSINRMRIKGAGSRFVHGGTTLQEIVIPIRIILRRPTCRPDHRHWARRRHFLCCSDADAPHQVGCTVLRFFRLCGL